MVDLHQLFAGTKRGEKRSDVDPQLRQLTSCISVPGDMIRLLFGPASMAASEVVVLENSGAGDVWWLLLHQP